MKKVFLLLLAATLWGGVWAEEPTGGRTGSGIELWHEKGAERRQSASDLLRELDREITRLFRAPPARRGRCRIFFSAARRDDECRMRRTPAQTDILLGDHFEAAWQTNPAFRRQLLRALLLARFAAVEGDLALPDWVGAGLDGVLDANRTSGRVARNIRYYPALRALLIAGNAPDFMAAVNLESPRFSGVEEKFYRELCRFLLETTSAVSSLKANALGDYVMAVVSNNRRPDEAWDATLRPRLAAIQPGMSAEALLLFAAERSAFNSRSPRPGTAALAVLPRELAIEYGKLNADGSVGLARQQGDYADLPLLFKQRHPQAVGLRDQLVQRLRFFGNTLSESAMPFTEKMIAELQALDGRGDPRDKAAALRAVRSELEAALRTQAAVESELEKQETLHVPLLLLYSDDFSLAAQRDQVLSSEALKFLNQIESEYLSE